MRLDVFIRIAAVTAGDGSRHASRLAQPPIQRARGNANGQPTWLQVPPSAAHGIYRSTYRIILRIDKAIPRRRLIVVCVFSLRVNSTLAPNRVGEVSYGLALKIE